MQSLEWQLIETGEKDFLHEKLRATKRARVGKMIGSG
jgi:hypothetical protein